MPESTQRLRDLRLEGLRHRLRERLHDLQRRVRRRELGRQALRWLHDRLWRWARVRWTDSASRAARRALKIMRKQLRRRELQQLELRRLRARVPRRRQRVAELRRGCKCALQLPRHDHAFAMRPAFDTQVDATHCGTCDVSCATTPHGTAMCATGTCGLTCDAGFSLCDGACVDTDTDSAHCGSCTKTCSANKQCVAGSCKKT